MNAWFSELLGAKKASFRKEILSGITVALALIPEAVAFAMVAGFSPLTGLYGAFIMGFVTSIIGGRPAMISGSGAIAVVFASLILSVKQAFPSIEQAEVMYYVFATVVMGGLIQVLFGAFRLGKFIRLVPHSVMFGFVNGLAIIIFLSQFPTILAIINGGEVPKFLSDITYTSFLSGLPSLGIMMSLITVTMLIIWLLPKFTKAVPSSLVAIVVVSSIVVLCGINTTTVVDTLAPGSTIDGSFPPFALPRIPFTLESLSIIAPHAFIFAGVGLIESLLTLNLVDEITESRGNANKECVAQGTANICSGFFSGMGGCAMVGQSMINVTSGGRTRLSSFVASITLLIFIVFGSSLIEKLPMAALIGVMFMVALGTFEWASLNVFRKMPHSDVFVMIIVTIITVATHNLALAVIIGIIISALVFSWENAKQIRSREITDDKGVKHYEIIGPLFFGSITGFSEIFDPANDPDEVVIDFAGSKIVDMSAIEAVNVLTHKYKKLNKTVHLSHLSDDCKILLQNADAIIDVNIKEDPTYKVVTNSIKQVKR
ncbi:MAG: SulP family inorganic anion transporter [Rikenellaceae bacterium]